MRAKREYITVVEVAEAAGLNEQTVRRHRREGVFRMGDLVSVSEYVIGWRLINGSGCNKGSGGSGGDKQ